MKEPFKLEFQQEMKDMKKEISDLKNSDEGCTEKCRITNEILKLDNQRSLPIINNVL